MKKNFTKKDLISHLKDCLKTLMIFNELYDSGEQAIAKDIAVKLRILFHNTNQSNSLIHQLNLEQIQFIDTADEYDSRSLLTHHGLLMLVFNKSGGHLFPQLQFSKIKYTTFERWWELDKVIVDRKKSSFTRRKIVLELSNTDGGAHVDSGINEPYFDISRANSLGWFYHDGSINSDKPLNDPIPPSIRQISYETLLTLHNLDIIKNHSF